MIFNKKSLVPDVALNFQLSDEAIIFSKETSPGNRKIFVNNTPIPVEQIGEFVVYKSIVLFYTEDYSLFCYDVKNKVIDLIMKEAAFPAEIQLGKYISMIKMSEGVSFLYDVEKLRILKKMPRRTILLNSEIGILINYESNKRYFSKIDLDENKTLWTFDMNALPQYVYTVELIYDSLQNLIGVVNSEIWLSTKANRIIVLDLTTGELVHMYSREPDEYMNGPAASHARIAGNKIVMLHRMLTVIDIATKEEELYVQSNTYFEELKNIRIDRVSELQGEYLTFTADKLGTGYLSTVMGVFNAKTLKVEWVYEFTPDKKISLSTLPPVLDGNRLYALDTKKNLHVFEEVS